MTTMTDSNAALRDILGAEPPAGLTVLNDADQQALADKLAQAQTAQQAQLRSALEDALRHVPRLLRGTVRRVLFP